MPKNFLNVQGESKHQLNRNIQKKNIGHGRLNRRGDRGK